MKTCRLCGAPAPRDLIDLGTVPSIHILHRDPRPVPLFPLHAFLCTTCGLAQMPTAQTQEVYEGSQVYTTSHNAGTYTRDLIDALKTMRTGAKALEIGCNDGAFLKALSESGFAPVLGVEPNHHARKIAQARGLEVMDGFFGAQMAADLRRAHGRFDLLVARHVLEHVDDIKGFLTGVHDLLSHEGIFLLEVPYVEPGFIAGAPNVLWDEHINYFTETTATAALEKAGFTVEMRRFYTGGALVMALLARRRTPHASANWPGLGNLAEVFSGFAGRVTEYRAALHEAVETASRQNRRIVLYGAGFRSATTINAMEIGELVSAVIDDRAEIAGYIMPGTRCPILPLKDTPPGDTPVLLLLGVGAEHERAVTLAARKHFASGVVTLSIVYPGDVLSLCRTATKELMALAHKMTEGRPC